MPHRPLFAFVLACVLVTLWPQAAQAEVRRCVTASGQTIFTDRHCKEVNAVERLPRDQVQAGALHRAGGCARSLQDLVFAMTSAIDTRDANRLASVYHWPGTSADSGYRIWTRLDAIANRPLVDIVPLMSASRPLPGPAATATSNDAAEATNAPVDPELYPQTAVRRNPVALRVEQTVGNSATPARTVFGLTHYFGCWWVQF
jgi:hypothetical protein